LAKRSAEELAQRRFAREHLAREQRRQPRRVGERRDLEVDEPRDRIAPAAGRSSSARKLSTSCW
jgi:hypothetical protein